MKPPALPTRISSIFAFLWMLFVAAIALLTLYTLFFTAQSRAGTIVIGNNLPGDDRPFGFKKSPTAVYLGKYQQIYAKTAFPGATQITQIAFAEGQGLGDVDVTYTMSIGLGVTARTPVLPGTGFASGAVPVFNGTASAHITATARDFDFTITLDTPFYYDPAQGNLLLEITLIGGTKSELNNTYGYFGADIDHGKLARIYDTGTAITAQPYHGLTTRFTTTPVPEPGVGALLLVGAAVSIRRRVHARRRALLSKGEPVGNTTGIF